MEKQYKPLNILLSVLLFGGLWGFLEATLGTILHLPLFDAAGMYACSTTIMVPIAMFLMGACYKRSGTFRSALYMGLIAASMKAIVCAIFHLSFNPVFYILLESVCMMGALAAIRPTKVLSFRGLGTFVLANTTYLALSSFIRMNPATTQFATFMAGLEKYTFMFNAVAIIYTFAFGAALYGVLKLVALTSVNEEKVNRIIYSPVTASIVMGLMVVASLTMPLLIK